MRYTLNHSTIICAFVLGLTLSALAQDQTKRVTISGEVSDAISKTTLANTNIYTESLDIGTTTDSLGRYILRLRPGNYRIIFQYLGYRTETRALALSIDSIQVTLHVDMYPVTLPGIEVEKVIAA